MSTGEGLGSQVEDDLGDPRCARIRTVREHGERASRVGEDSHGRGAADVERVDVSEGGQRGCQPTEGVVERDRVGQVEPAHEVGGAAGCREEADPALIA